MIRLANQTHNFFVGKMGVTPQIPMVIRVSLWLGNFYTAKGEQAFINMGLCKLSPFGALKPEFHEQ